MMEVNPLYPGPKQAGPDGERYRLKDPAFFDNALKYCLNCKRCEVACPSGVKIGDIIAVNKLKYYKSEHKMRDTALASTDLVGSLASPFAPIVNGVLSLGVTKSVMDGVLGVSKHRTFPKYSSRKFTSWLRRHAHEQNAYPRKVTYFHGCYVSYNYPQLGKDFVKLMNACGYGVRLLEKEKCCGVALIANGLPQQAKKQGEVNMSSMEKAINGGNEAVLTTSSTCTFTMRDEYKDLLNIDNSKVRDSLMLATRFLCQKIEEGKIKLAFRDDFHKKAAYHTACHMERMGWSVYSIQLLKMIPGLDLTVLESHCCGIAGTYGFKKENYERSQKIGAPLFQQIREVNPDCVATDCETCKWQIDMSTGYTVENPISLLAQAIDVEATRKLNQ